MQTSPACCRVRHVTPNSNWQTPQRGTNDQEYQIYAAAAESLGWAVKTYEQWLNT